MKYTIVKATRPDNTGGFDYSVYEIATKHIVAEFYEHVGNNQIGGYVTLKDFCALLNAKETN